jgi:hypothetical protein
MSRIAKIKLIKPEILMTQQISDRLDRTREKIVKPDDYISPFKELPSCLATSHARYAAYYN